MEIFELRYFAAVAELENIHKASEKMNVSASALSKAISRLEETLQAELFSREGRNIRLTEKGRRLYEQSNRFFELEDETRALVSDAKATIEIRLCGPEIFLAYFGVNLISRVMQKYPEASFSFQDATEDEAAAKVLNRQADLCIATEPQNRNPQLKYIELDEISFSTYVSKAHPLAGRRKAVPMAELLKFDFVMPLQGILGATNIKQSSDGWRDDKFKRRIRFKNVGLKTIERLLDEGKAVAYLPSYFAAHLPVQKIEIGDCPYSCKQKVFAIVRRDGLGSWQRALRV